MSILEMKRASRIYKNGRGLDKTDFVVLPGEIVGLLGMNGSGKTTLMKLAAGLMRPDSGEVLVSGIDVCEHPETALKGVGALIETPALYEYLSAEKNLRAAAKYMGLKSGEEISGILRLVGLERFAKEKAKAFSLGMRQRLGLAMAFLGEKQLLLLDEPINGLDIESAFVIKDAIRDVCRAKGAAAIVSGHTASEIERLCTRVVVLKDGRVMADTSMQNALKENETLEDFYLERVRKGNVM